MAKFCCCLPLRLGTLIIAFFQFFFNAAGAIVLWILLFASKIPKSWWDVNGQNIQPPELKLSTVQKVFTIISAVVLSLAAIFSIIGFIGALTKKTSFIHGFRRVLNYLIGFHLGTGIANIVIWAVNKNSYTNECIRQLADNPDLKDVQDDACSLAWRAILISLIVATVIPFLLDIYAWWVVRDYSNELDERKRAKTAFNLTAPTDMPYKYAAADTKEDAVPLTHEQFSQPYNAYPYSQTHNSYGNSYNTPYSK